MERRMNMRVSDYFPISYRVISPAQYETLEPIYRTTPSTEWGSPEGLVQSTTAIKPQVTDPVMAALLAELLKKVDQILQILSPAKTELTTDPSFEKATCVDLSGGGLRLRGDRRLKAGGLLDLLVPLPIAASSNVRILATVVRDSEPVSSLHEAAVTFTTINEEDREQLIAYVFHRQRQILAANRRLSQSEV